jgi:hypothetical protein
MTQVGIMGRGGKGGKGPLHVAGADDIDFYVGAREQSAPNGDRGETEALLRL